MDKGNRKKSFKKLELLVNSRNITFYKLADELGLARSTFSDWKKGKSCPKLFKLVKIAECLDCSLDYLVTGKEHHSVVEEATKDLALSKMDSRIKDYALKLSKLSDKEQENIMNLIDMMYGNTQNKLN